MPGTKNLQTALGLESHTMPGGTSVVQIHTVECKNVGPAKNCWGNLAQLQIFEVKFANIKKANFCHQMYYRTLLFTQGSKNKCK